MRQHANNQNDTTESRRRRATAAGAVVAMIAASALAVEAKSGGTASAGDGASAAAIPAAPAPITGVSGPDLDRVESPAELDHLTDLEFVIPVLARPELRLPEPPPVNVEAIREASRSWLGDGVLPAPTGVIEVDGPDLAALDREMDDGRIDRIEVPVLVRPELPVPPAVR